MAGNNEVNIVKCGDAAVVGIGEVPCLDDVHGYVTEDTRGAESIKILLLCVNFLKKEGNGILPPVWVV